MSGNTSTGCWTKRRCSIFFELPRASTLCFWESRKSRRRSKSTWKQARNIDSAGVYLNSALGRTLEVSQKVRSETTIGKLGISIPTAALELARDIFGTLENRRVLLLGTDEMCELSVRHMMNHGVGSVVVIDQSPARARQLAKNWEAQPPAWRTGGSAW